MQELRRILIKKGKTIGELKYPLQNNRQAMIHHLKSLRKQQVLNESIQTKILSGLDSLSFQTKQELQNLYHFSFTVMKSLSKELVFTPPDNGVYTDILELHDKFYQTEGACEMSGRIKYHMKNKTMMEKKFLLKKLVQWLYEWVKSSFQESLNKSINMVERNVLGEKIFAPVTAFQDSTYFVKQEKQRKHATFNGTRMNLLSTQMLKKKTNKTEGKAVTQNSPSLLTQQAEITFLGNQQQNNKTCHDTSTRISTSYDNQQSVEFVPKTIGIKKRSFSYNREGVQKQKSVSFLPHINKEIFYGAFNQQLSQLYKTMGDVMDVDTYYLRSFRRQKEELKDQIVLNRIDEVVDLIAKNMPKIQKSINKYSQDYNKYCPEYIKSFHSESNILIRESPKGQKSTFLQKYPRKRPSLSQKLKSEEIFNNNKEIQQLFKNTKTSKFRQRNRSFQQRFTRKLSKEKTQILTKLPVTYNADVFNSKQDSKTGKAITIHQKMQNFTPNTDKLENNKGLVRYKVLSKDREKSIIQQENLINNNVVSYGMELFQTKKLNEFQVANIRKLLRIREKQRVSAKKTPITLCVKSKNEQLDNIMGQAREIETQRSKNLNQVRKASRYEVFLNNLNRGNHGSILIGKEQAQNQQVVIYSYCQNEQNNCLPKLS